VDEDTYLNYDFDITEREQAEKSLQESETNFQALARNANDGIAVITAEGKHLFASQRAAEITGYSRSELLESVNTLDLIHPDLLEERKEYLQKRVAGEMVPTHYESILVTKDGHFIPIEVSAARTLWRGQPSSLVIFRDITERVKAEQELQESEMRYRLLFEHAAEGIMIADPQGNIHDVNESVCRMLGYSREEILQMETRDIFTKEDQRTNPIIGLEEVQGGESFYVECQLIRKDKKIMTAAIRFRILPNGLVQGFIHDVTERVLAEQALSESEERMKLALEGTNQGLWEWTVLTETVEIDDNGFRMLGYTPGEMDFNFGWWEKSIHPDSRRIFETALNDIREGREKYIELEIQIKDKSGEWRWLWGRGTCLDYGEQGEPLRIIGTYSDITESKRAEEALKESESRLRRIVENMPVMLDALDAGGNIIVWNQECERVTGYKAEQIVNNPCALELLYPDQAYLQAAMERWERVGSDFRGWEMDLTCKSGEIKTVMWFNISERFPIPGWNSWSVGVDITERVQAEEALQESEARFRSIFEHSPITLWEEDFSQVKAYIDDLKDSGVSNFEVYFKNHPKDLVHCASLVKLVNINEISLDLLQADSREDILKGLDAFFDDAAYEVLRKELAAFANGENQFITETAFSTLKGEDKYGYITVSIMPGYEHTWEKVLLSLIDLTELKRTEAVLYASRRLADLGTLAAGVAHEINSPLQIITGTSETATRRLRDGQVDKERLIRNMDSINQNAWRVAHIVRSLMTYAQISHEETKPSNLNAIIKDTLLLIEHQMRNWASIVITSELAPDLPSLECDRNSITQMLINLFSNARDAMPQGGEITIRTRYDAERGNLVLQVKDTGHGIPDEIRPKIFDPFFTTKPIGEGTGLGLSIVLGIIQSHGGEINVDSQFGQGTTFTITLPKKQIEGISEIRTERNGRYSSN
jgi:PAS domain S-box-containing protein